MAKPKRKDWLKAFDESFDELYDVEKIYYSMLSTGQNVQVIMESYSCPGISRQQVNQVSDRKDCCFSALGNALQENHYLFSSRARNLGTRVRGMIEEIVLGDEGVRKSLIACGHSPKQHLNTEREGNNIDIQLFALWLFENSEHKDVRIFVHSKKTNDYRWAKPFVRGQSSACDAAPYPTVDCSDIKKTDIVLIHSLASHHWSYARATGGEN